MRQFRLSTERYRQKLIDQFGFASEILVKEYAEARQAWKRDRRSQRGSFNVYTQDPNCKTCGKDRRK